MAIVNAPNLNAGVVIGNIQQKLIAHRKALADLADLFAWSSGITAADLTGVGVSPDDAPVILSAIADAHAEYLLHTTGLPPATYPQPPQTYVYGASQTQVIGPQ
jgi:hypothetical protein